MWQLSGGEDEEKEEAVTQLSAVTGGRGERLCSEPLFSRGAEGEEMAGGGVGPTRGELEESLPML